MQTKPVPEIAVSDLKAVRDFLTSFRDEERASKSPRNLASPGGAPVKNGIARARLRSSAAKPA